MKRNDIEYYVGELWKCDCGSLNAAYNTICGKCNKNK